MGIYEECSDLLICLLLLYYGSEGVKLDVSNDC